MSFPVPNTRRRLLLCLYGLCLAGVAVMADPTHTLDIESGLVFPGYNDVRIPGASGTKLSLTEELSAAPFPAYRIRYTVAAAGKHELGLLAAFLTMRADGVTPSRSFTTP